MLEQARSEADEFGQELETVRVSNEQVRDSYLIGNLTAGKDATSRQIEAARAEAEEMRQQLEAARNERQATADSLASSQQAVARLTDTLQGVSDARDRMEEQIDTFRVSASCRSAS